MPNELKTNRAKPMFQRGYACYKLVNAGALLPHSVDRFRPRTAHSSWSQPTLYTGKEATCNTEVAVGGRQGHNCRTRISALYVPVERRTHLPLDL